MNKSTAFGLLASVSLTSLATPAFAQSADGATANEDVIVVTARKREENLIDVPLPVSVVTAAQLERDQVRSITDLQRMTPALEVSQTSGGEVNGGARLRGLGTGVFNASVSPSVAFVVDQVPQGNLAFPVLFDLGQVEVLRGPQGTLFGQGASAGVINISTVAPTTSGIHVSGGIDYADKGTAGSEVGEMTVRGAFNLPLGDHAAIRVATQYRKETGLQRNTFLGLDNKIEDYAIRIRALLEPSDNFTVNLSGEYVRQKMAGWNFFAIAIAPNATNLIDPDGPGPAPTLPVSVFSNGDFANTAGCNIPAITARAEFYCEDTQTQMNNQSGGISARVDWSVNDAVTLTSVTAYRELDRETTTVNFSRRLGVAARSENIQSESRQFSQELRLAYDSDALKLVTGALYSGFRIKSTPIENIGFGSPFPGKRTGFSVCLQAGFFCPVPTNFSYEDTNNNNKALFADATFSVTDQLDLFGGIRYSDYENTTRVGVNSYQPSNASTIKDTDVSGRVGISFKPSEGSTIYASFARGYKPPAIVVPTIAGGVATNLRPEKADAFEIGAKYQMGHLQLSANAFYSKVKDFQVQNQVFDKNGSLISVTQNISQVVSKGFEFGVMGRVADFLTINGGYQYNDVKFPTGFLGNDGINLGGTQFLNAPKHKFTLSGEFTLPVSPSMELFSNANVVYKSAVLLGQYGNPAYRYPAHTIINAGFGVRDADGKWTLSVFARNLTKQREPTAYLASDFAGNSDGGIRAWPAAGLTARVVGVSAGFNF